MIITNKCYCSAVSFKKLWEQSAMKRKGLHEYRTERYSGITIWCTFEQQCLESLLEHRQWHRCNDVRWQAVPHTSGSDGKSMVTSGDATSQWNEECLQYFSELWSKLLHCWDILSYCVHPCTSCNISYSHLYTLSVYCCSVCCAQFETIFSQKPSLYNKFWATHRTPQTAASVSLAQHCKLFIIS